MRGQPVLGPGDTAEDAGRLCLLCRHVFSSPRAAPQEWMHHLPCSLLASWLLVSVCNHTLVAISQICKASDAKQRGVPIFIFMPLDN